MSRFVSPLSWRSENRHFVWTVDLTHRIFSMSCAVFTLLAIRLPIFLQLLGIHHAVNTSSLLPSTSWWTPIPCPPAPSPPMRLLRSSWWYESARVMNYSACSRKRRSWRSASRACLCWMESRSRCRRAVLPLCNSVPCLFWIDSLCGLPHILESTITRNRRKHTNESCAIMGILSYDRCDAVDPFPSPISHVLYEDSVWPIWCEYCDCTISEFLRVQ